MSRMDEQQFLQRLIDALDARLRSEDARNSGNSPCVNTNEERTQRESHRGQDRELDEITFWELFEESSNSDISDDLKTRFENKSGTGALGRSNDLSPSIKSGDGSRSIGKSIVTRVFEGIAERVASVATVSIGGLDDQDLVSGLRGKEEYAVAIFMDRYRPLFYHCISQMEKDQHARDDLYNEVVSYVLERLDKDSFDPLKGSFGTWLYRVAWCRCVDLKRKESLRRKPKLLSVGEGLPERVDHSPGPGEVAGENEIGDMIRRGMSSLEPEERALLELRFIEDRTIGEISGVLSLSLEQVKYRLKRASTALRRVLLSEFALERAHHGDFLGR